MRSLDGFGCDDPVMLVRGCARVLPADIPFRDTELACCYPPRVHPTSRSGRRYRHDCTDADHVALLAPFTGPPCQVMVSDHPSAPQDRMLSHWRRIALQVTTPARVRGEVVRINFASGRMYFADHAGQNATDRQCINCEVARGAQHYRTIPPGERLAVITAIMAIEAGVGEVQHGRAACSWTSFRRVRSCALKGPGTQTRHRIRRLTSAIRSAKGKRQWTGQPHTLLCYSDNVTNNDTL